MPHQSKHASIKGSDGLPRSFSTAAASSLPGQWRPLLDHYTRKTTILETLIEPNVESTALQSESLEDPSAFESIQGGQTGVSTDGAAYVVAALMDELRALAEAPDLNEMNFTKLRGAVEAEIQACGIEAFKSNLQTLLSQIGSLGSPPYGANYTKSGLSTRTPPPLCKSSRQSTRRSRKQRVLSSSKDIDQHQQARPNDSDSRMLRESLRRLQSSVQAIQMQFIPPSATGLSIGPSSTSSAHSSNNQSTIRTHAQEMTTTIAATSNQKIQAAKASLLRRQTSSVGTSEGPRASTVVTPPLLLKRGLTMGSGVVEDTRERNVRERIATINLLHQTLTAVATMAAQKERQVARLMEALTRRESNWMSQDEDFRTHPINVRRHFKKLGKISEELECQKELLSRIKSQLPTVVSEVHRQRNILRRNISTLRGSIKRTSPALLFAELEGSVQMENLKEQWRVPEGMEPEKLKHRRVAILSSVADYELREFLETHPAYVDVLANYPRTPLLLEALQHDGVSIAFNGIGTQADSAGESALAVGTGPGDYRQTGPDGSNSTATPASKISSMGSAGNLSSVRVVSFIGHWMEANKYLYRLALDDCAIPVNAWENFAARMSHICRVTEVAITRCGITPVLFTILLKGLRRNPIAILDLGYNHLGVDGIRLLSRGLTQRLSIPKSSDDRSSSAAPNRIGSSTVTPIPPAVSIPQPLLQPSSSISPSLLPGRQEKSSVFSLAADDTEGEDGDSDSQQQQSRLIKGGSNGRVQTSQRSSSRHRLANLQPQASISIGNNSATVLENRISSGGRANNPSSNPTGPSPKTTEGAEAGVGSGDNLNPLLSTWELSNVIAAPGGYPPLGLALVELKLAVNNLKDKGAIQIADILKSGAVPNLRTLDLRWNKIGVEGAAAVASALQHRARGDSNASGTVRHRIGTNSSGRDPTGGYSNDHTTGSSTTTSTISPASNSRLPFLQNRSPSHASGSSHPFSPNASVPANELPMTLMRNGGFGRCSPLESLNLAGNNIGAVGASSILTALAFATDCAVVQSLNLSMNHINSDVVSTLITWVRNAAESADAASKIEILDNTNVNLEWNEINDAEAVQRLASILTSPPYSLISPLTPYATSPALGTSICRPRHDGGSLFASALDKLGQDQKAPGEARNEQTGDELLKDHTDMNNDISNGVGAKEIDVRKREADQYIYMMTNEGSVTTEGIENSGTAILTESNGSGPAAMPTAFVEDVRTTRLPLFNLANNDVTFEGMATVASATRGRLQL